MHLSWCQIDLSLQLCLDAEFAFLAAENTYSNFCSVFGLQFVSADDAQVFSVETASKIVGRKSWEAIVQHDVEIRVRLPIFVIKYLHNKILVLTHICILDVTLKLIQSVLLICDSQVLSELLLHIYRIISPQFILVVSFQFLL